MRGAFVTLWGNPLVKVLVALLALAVLAWFLSVTRAVWFIVVTAFVLAYLLHPVVAWSRSRFRAAGGRSWASWRCTRSRSSGGVRCWARWS